MGVKGNKGVSKMLKKEKISLKWSNLAFLFVIVFLISASTSFASYTTDLIAGQNYDVGDVTVWDDGTYLYVKYQTIFGWYMSATHLHVATTLKGIPQANGNPIPGRFAYKTNHNPMVSEFTYKVKIPGSGMLYIATHADTCTSLKTSPSGTVNLSTQFGVKLTGWDSYIKVYVNGLVLNGYYEGFCIEPDKGIFSNISYTSGLTSTYDPSAAILVTYGQNLDLVNFILNQDLVGKNSISGGQYTFGDIQQAIWMLVAGTYKTNDPQIGLWSPARAQEIIDLANMYGEGYVPPPGGVMAVILCPKWDVFGDGTLILDMQKIIIIVPVPYGGCETAWGKGPGFSGKNWAMYFTYTP